MTPDAPTGWSGEHTSAPTTRPGQVFVPGKPLTDIWAKPGLRWHDTLSAHRSACPTPASSHSEIVPRHAPGMA